MRNRGRGALVLAYVHNPLDKMFVEIQFGTSNVAKQYFKCFRYYR